MKRLAAFTLFVLICLSVFSGCGSKKKDWAYIEDKGTLIIGYTIYEPMNYKDENGELVGFDTEFAKLVCAELGVEPKFQEIDWEAKITELNSKNIDCIWNGFTVDDERKGQVDFTLSYMINRQVAVIKKSNADKYKTLDDMKDASFAAEKKSAGEKAIQTNDKIKNNQYTAMDAQTGVLLEVNSGTTDVGVVDYIMAKSMIGEGTSYADLMIVEGVQLEPEEYAIGFRKGDTVLVEKVNAAIQKLADEGKLKALAEKYEILDNLPENLK